jgi:hypothetical protein
MMDVNADATRAIAKMQRLIRAGMDPGRLAELVGVGPLAIGCYLTGKADPPPRVIEAMFTRVH